MENQAVFGSLIKVKVSINFQMAHFEITGVALVVSVDYYFSRPVRLSRIGPGRPIPNQREGVISSKCNILPWTGSVGLAQSQNRPLRQVKIQMGGFRRTGSFGKGNVTSPVCTVRTELVDAIFVTPVSS